MKKSEALPLFLLYQPMKLRKMNACPVNAVVTCFLPQQDDTWELENMFPSCYSSLLIVMAWTIVQLVWSYQLAQLVFSPLSLREKLPVSSTNIVPYNLCFNLTYF